VVPAIESLEPLTTTIAPAIHNRPLTNVPPLPSTVAAPGSLLSRHTNQSHHIYHINMSANGANGSVQATPLMKSYEADRDAKSTET
jgi:hypothetical protein